MYYCFAFTTSCIPLFDKDFSRELLTLRLFGDRHSAVLFILFFSAFPIKKRSENKIEFE